MASVFTHAALPLLAGRGLKLPEGVDRQRLARAAVFCSVLPDLDLLGLVFDIRPEELLGYRGLSHSLIVAAALALAVTALAFRGSRFKQVFALLFICAASHGVLDAATRGDQGVALLAPFTDARILFPLRLLPVCPLGVKEWFGPLGLTVLLNEALLLLAPVGLLAELFVRRRAQRPLKPLALAAGAWAGLALLLFVAAPNLYAPTKERVFKPLGPPKSDEDLSWILLDPLASGNLEQRFDAFERQGLFGKKLEPARVPWSSGFFPAWYGSIAGRWKDSKFRLIGRTLKGFAPPTANEAAAWLARNQGEGMSPTEKYDLARSDPTFAATTHSLKLGHNRNPLPRFWYGVCIGIAGAAIEHDEPFRAVDVVRADGQTVRFHPNDVKALLGEAYYRQARGGTIGGGCEGAAFDAGAECSMNPAGLFVGTLNYLGLAKRSFVVDVHPTTQSQFYAVASARVDVTRAAYAPSDEPFAPGFKEQVAKLVDVDFTFEMSSTVLSVNAGDLPVPGDPTRFARVGLRPVPFHWQATLALDEISQVIGGRWRGDPADGPDSASFLGGGPRLGEDGKTLEVHPALEWAFIEQLAKASVDDGPQVPVLRMPTAAGEPDPKK